MVFFVGDLSANDAAVLATLARDASSIIEFGVGGSTQIFAQCAPAGAHILSLDTSVDWLDRTKATLRAMALHDRVMFQSYPGQLDRAYDLAFDDGIIEHRLDFASRVWPHLTIGGKLVFHDTRRPFDYMNAVQIITTHYLEIDIVEANAANSNLTIITKKARGDYQDWNEVEQRSEVSIGRGTVAQTLAYVKQQRAASVSVTPCRLWPPTGVYTSHVKHK